MRNLIAAILVWLGMGLIITAAWRYSEVLGYLTLGIWLVIFGAAITKAKK